MKIKKITVGVLSLITALVLYGCGNSNNDSEMKMDHSKMEHSGSSEVPKGLKVAENPTYKVGSKATITEGHMEGMKGAEATIVGAYDTIAYAVTYTPTNGGEKVPNHKWVIQEEIKEANTKQFEPGAEVTLNADHMKGMKGAKVTIDSAEHTTVYMIDFKPTNGGETVKNHKWLTESELSPVK
ncbi:YdhK family protein [Gottfriedia acidiceleris]|uniref:YdhK family protein n=1 Tax=Gottfriedia acidiceleris TaxID=371036 RepID=UPI002FFDCA27